MSKRILVILSICFFFCVTAKSIVPLPEKADVFSKTANAAGLIEKEMAKGNSGKSLKTLASLNRMNKNVKLENMNSAAEKELVSSLKDKSVNNAAGTENKTAFFEKYRLNKSKSGYVKFIGAPQGKHFAVDPDSKGKFADKHEVADTFIKKHRKIFAGDSSSLTYVMKKISGSTKKSVKYNQLYGGIRVFGAEMIVQVNDEDGVDCVISDIMTDSSKLDDSTIGLTPTIDSASAAEIARVFVRENYSGLNNRRSRDSNVRENYSGLIDRRSGFSKFYPEGSLSLETSNIELMIFDPSVVDKDGCVALVWKVEVSGTAGQPIKEVVLVNAHDEGVEFNYSLIYDSRVRQIYDSENSTADPGTLKRSEGGPASGIGDVDLAYDFYGDTYDFYYDLNGRDSIDDVGMTMSATVRYCYLSCPFYNAFWDGSRMYFGEGFVVDDIVGHELTHGVTQYESGLIYQGESGAINESLSDMWGEWIDLTNSAGTDTEAVEWLLGEDSPFGAIRCMKNPTMFGDPDRYNSPYFYRDTLWDNGGVHWNSGVGNKLCYLLTDGDTFNGYAIAGEGITFTERLFYECQVSLLTDSSNYEDLYYALIQAAINLNATAAQQTNIQKACCAVEINMGDDGLPPVHNVNQDTWYVTIQAAINAAVTGDEIVVSPGTYIDEINFGGKSITLRSSNPDDWDVVGATIIDTSDEFVNTVTFDSGENSASVLKGFTLRTYGSSFGIYCDSSSPTVRNCIIEGSMYGIICIYSSSPMISNCIVRNSSMGGIDCYSSSPTITDCIVANNPGYYGINCYYYSSPVISNCTVVNNGAGINNYLGSPVITNCILWGNVDSDLDGCSATYSCIEYGNPGTGNISSDPLFVASDPFFHLASNSPCINAGDPSGNYSGQMDTDGDVRVIEQRADIGADEFKQRVHNVNQDTWYMTIQAAIDEAVTGDQIVVYPGIYEETVNFNGKAITIQGSDPDDWEVVDSTVIDASIFGQYGGDCVTFNHGESLSSVLTGIKMTTGSTAACVRCNAEPNSLAASPAIRNCIMEYAQFGVFGPDSSPEISNCIIRHIDVDGLQCGGSVINDCVVEFCGDVGISCGGSISDCIVGYCGEGIDCSGSTSNCTVVYTYGDGIRPDNDNAIVSNCAVVKSSYDGIRFYYTSPSIKNCILIGNMAGIFCGLDASGTISNSLSIYNRESGIFCRETSSPLISNCTIVGNYFGVISETNTNDIFTNCIFWKNIGYEIYGSATITYSDVEGGFPGTGNINSDPLFVPSDPLFQLGSSSACINTGDPSGNYTGQTDIDGDVRVIGGRVDIGADENEDVPILNITRHIVYQTIQSAVDNANPNDEIVVYPGTYHETVSLPNKPITLRSSNPDNWDIVGSTVIIRNGVSLPATINYPNSPDNTNIVFKGFTVTGSGYGIASAGRPPISNCIIRNNTNDGVHADSGAPQVRNCIIRANGRHGVYVYGDSDFSVRNCFIYSNAGTGIEHEMWVDEEDPQQFLFPVIVNNTIVSNAVSGFNQTPMTYSVVTNCILWGNGFEDMYGQATYCCIEDGDPGTGNISANPCFVDAANGDYRLLNNSPCITSGTNSAVISGDLDIDNQPRIVHGAIEIGADETSYASVLNITRDIAYKKIQPAIDNANPNDEIVVYPGTYNETILFPIKAITLRSSDPNNWDVVASTIITRNGGRIATINYTSTPDNSNIVVKGLTITGGIYGIYPVGGKPPISNCIIRNNTSYGVCSVMSSPQLRNCIIRNNGNHGIYVGGDSEFWVKNCLIYSNGGSGIYHSMSGTQTRWPQIANNTIVSNTGYGVYNLPVTNSVVSNCILWQNGIEDMYGLATYSCIEDGDAGTGNISANPCFADAANGNYHLASNSPCIDIGNNSATSPAEYDIDHDGRIIRWRQ